MSRTTPLPRAACWLIEYQVGGRPRAVGYGHNAIADYRGIDRHATVRAFDLVAAVEVIDAAQRVVDGTGDIAELRAALTDLEDASP